MLKKLFGALLLAVISLTFAPNCIAETPTTEKIVDVTSVINKLSKSVFLIERWAIDKGLPLPRGFEPPILKVGKGSSVCVSRENGRVIFLTARHVTKDASYLVLIVREKRFKIEKWVDIPYSDVSYFIIGDLDVEPVKFNLSPDSNIVPSVAAGMWGHNTELSATMGYVSRKVATGMSEKVYNYALVKGFIYGTLLIYPGYSGGPLVDEYGHLLGINVLLTNRTTTYFDSRFIWNSVPELNKGKLVEIPWDGTLNVCHAPEHFKRIAFSNNDLIIRPTPETTLTFQQFIAYVDDNVSGRMPLNWLMPEKTEIKLGEKLYKVAKLHYEAEDDNQVIGYSVQSNDTYLYVCGEGWNLIIFLAPA